MAIPLGADRRYHWVRFSQDSAWVVARYWGQSLFRDIDNNLSTPVEVGLRLEPPSPADETPPIIVTKENQDND